MNRYYVLDGHEVRATDDHEEWARMWEQGDKARRVARDDVGKASVSTVFLGLNHNWGGGPPLLFETMIFGGEHEEACWRYTTWAEAESSHRKIVKALMNGCDPYDCPQ